VSAIETGNPVQRTPI